MTALHWRTARELRLIAKIIPDPHNPGECLDRLADVRVAASGSVLYVDTQATGQDERGAPPGAGDPEVYAIPSSSVIFLAFR
ncbi:MULTISPECIES: hypothetical protein [Streptacidiphilus]|uniref:Uncharacterized protein n=1 Tax=Streptacidiphilus cavernicola TaxID=3342716 RepID=A0ABV6UZQ2_9ACTN|nr:hypothetical protein [Streptacidiphilus jeojiense]